MQIGDIVTLGVATSIARVIFDYYICARIFNICINSIMYQIECI